MTPAAFSAELPTGAVTFTWIDLVNKALETDEGVKRLRDFLETGESIHLSFITGDTRSGSLFAGYWKAANGRVVTVEDASFRLMRAGYDVGWLSSTNTILYKKNGDQIPRQLLTNGKELYERDLLRIL